MDLLICTYIMNFMNLTATDLTYLLSILPQCLCLANVLSTPVCTIMSIILPIRILDKNLL